jgi:hypothetical protein
LDNRAGEATDPRVTVAWEHGCRFDSMKMIKRLKSLGAVLVEGSRHPYWFGLPASTMVSFPPSTMMYQLTSFAPSR